MKAFEEALWSGDVDSALGFVSEGFSYRFPFAIMGPGELRAFIGADEGHVRVESTGFATEGNVVSWTSIRYFPGLVGQSVALTATFESDLIAEISETGAPTTAEDAIGCEGSFPYIYHADYGPDVVGVSADPVEATVEGFPDAVEGLVYTEAALEMEAPTSGGHEPVVRVSRDGHTVGFVFLIEQSDGSLLIDGVTACPGLLEPDSGPEVEGDL